MRTRHFFRLAENTTANPLPFVHIQMRHLAAYLLLQIGGNASPSAADIKKVLGAVGVEADDERLEKLIAELEAEWEGVTDEIRELGQTIQYGSLTEEEFAAGMRPTNGVDAAVIEALRREVVDVADEFEAGVREMKEAEKALKRRQERFLADTIRTMGEL